METLKIILVDDNNSFRSSLHTLLVKQYQVEIIGEAANASEFFTIDKYFLANIIFMDVMMPDINGIELTKKILQIHNHLKIIAITMHYDTVYLTTLIESGFVGCIFKNNVFNELELAMNAVTKGCLFFPQNIILKMK